MAGGNKKKKKPAANPARGFATTSTQSKSKTESLKESESTEASGAATPERDSTATTQDDTAMSQSELSRELHELSPEELEAQLETSELQQFVENHAAKVRKDASRQVSRLQTEKRLLRGQADFLSVKEWLPDELMQVVFDSTLADLEHDRHTCTKTSLKNSDDLVAKIWTLRLVLVDLEIPLERANETIDFLLHHPPPGDSAGQTWGLVEIFDWLSLYCGPSELSDYDAQKRSKVVDAEEELDDSIVESSTEHGHPNRSPDLSSSGTDLQADSPLTDTETDVSDVESDLEPDELLTIYLREKERLYVKNPSLEDAAAKRNSRKTLDSTNKAALITNSAQRKLQRKLQKIQSDVLFDQREADAQWAVRKTDVARADAQRRRLQLSNGIASKDHSRSISPSKPTSGAEDVLARAAEMAEGVTNDDSGGDCILSGMFDAFPGVSEAGQSGSTPSGDQKVTIRDFGRITGMTPRRILDEICRSRDSACRTTYKQISATTLTCRHCISIDWTKDQDIPTTSFIPSVEVKSRLRQTIIRMTSEATPDVAQSESYVATAALFVVFAGSPKEEKSHLRLPPAYRDLWNEFSLLRREHIDAADRDTVKALRHVIVENIVNEDESDDEVVFNASTRRLNGATNDTSTPVSRSLTPAPSGSDEQECKELWARKASGLKYQQMLFARMNLPMFHAKGNASDVIGKNQITIVVGDTGSGKSTQVPHFLLEHELSNGRNCKIYCTQPRRISAISLAQRVSEELGEQKGELGTSRSLVGYAIRLESHTAFQTRLVYATVGIVLRMLENADGLKDVTHLVLDEVHERSIDTDFLLIVLQSLVKTRPDLKIILMSATVDAQKFSNYLAGAPIIIVPGRTFPVQVRFLEDAIEITGHTNEDVPAALEDDEKEDESDPQGSSKPAHQLEGYSKRTRNTLAQYDEYRIDYALIVKLLEVVAYNANYHAFSRAVLIFVPGIQEIRQLNDMLTGHPSFSRGWRIHALHSSFASEDQQAAFDIPPNGERKIVIATNIAETGITIPDITCVIDTGKHREMRFDERRQMSRLTQSFIARANAKQRRGRAGRVQEGICFHLFTQYRYNDLMAEQQAPEMLRLSLQDLVMRVKICKLGGIEQALSEALDPPSSKNIRRAIDALIEVGALTESEQLTPLGTQLAKLPLDAQLGKLILLGTIFGCLDFCLTIAAALSSKSPFLSPMHAKKQADSVRLGFKRGDSDLLTLFNAYSAWRKICTTQSLSEYQFCNKNFLSAQNLANIEDLKGQLMSSLAEAGFVSLQLAEKAVLSKVRPGSRKRNFVPIPENYCRTDDNDLITASVVAWSFYPKIVRREGKGWRNVANNQSLGLHPTSVNKTTLSPDVKYLSFYSIMQSSSKFTNAQETTPVSDFALVLLAGDAVFHMYAGVIIVDGNRLRFKVRDWKTMIVLKALRAKVKEALGRLYKSPGRPLSDRQSGWMDLVERMFEQRKV